MSRIVVVGEALLDIDLEGTATRLSPESPVPVLDDLAERDRPGGAALAAALAARDGHSVVLVSPLARDAAATRLRIALGQDVEVVALPSHGATPVKRRVRAAGHNLVRLDEGGRAGAWGGAIAEVDAALATADAIVVSDYGRGLTKDPDFRATVEAAGQRVPLVWDPHPRGGPPVASTLVATPNLAELRGIVGATSAVPDAGPVRDAALLAAMAVSTLDLRAVAVTLGGAGALLSFGDGPPEMFAARPVPGDPCGAGDRFAVSVAAALAGGELLSRAVEAATQAATRYVSSGGAAAFSHATADRTEQQHRIGPTWAGRTPGEILVATGGCFDLLHAGHVAMLESARSLGDRLVVLVNSDASVRRLKGPSRPLVPETDRIRVLSSLACVDEVLMFDEDTPAVALDRLRPDIWVKGGDYAGRRLPEEDVLDRWGGQAVVVPYLQGRSTSNLVRAMHPG